MSEPDKSRTQRSGDMPDTLFGSGLSSPVRVRHVSEPERRNLRAEIEDVQLAAVAEQANVQFSPAWIHIEGVAGASEAPTLINVTQDRAGRVGVGRFLRDRWRLFRVTRHYKGPPKWSASLPLRERSAQRPGSVR